MWGSFGDQESGIGSTEVGGSVRNRNIVVVVAGGGEVEWEGFCVGVWDGVRFCLFSSSD